MCRIQLIAIIVPPSLVETRVFIIGNTFFSPIIESCELPEQYHLRSVEYAIVPSIHLYVLRTFHQGDFKIVWGISPLSNFFPYNTKKTLIFKNHNVCSAHF